MKMSQSQLSNCHHDDMASEGKKAARQRAAQTLLTSMLTKAGVELDKLEALQKQSEADRDARIAQCMTEADEQAAARRGTVRRDVEHWRESIARLKTLAPPAAPAQTIWLETASDITATPGITLDATQMAPTNNWAQFYWPTFDNGGYEEAVGFGFLWQNASAQHVVVNVTGFPILIGDLQAIAYGYYNPFELSFCNMRVDVRLNIQELWNQPPTSPPLQPGQEWGVVTNRASAGFFDDPEIVDKRVERGLVLGYDQLVVPPQGTVRIEVSCVMDTAHRNGEARFIFTNFDRQVQAYAVVINVLP